MWTTLLYVMVVVVAVPMESKAEEPSRPKRLIDNYHTQMVREINSLATLFPKSTMSNHDFAMQLFNKLRTTFHTRDWFVLVSDPYDAHKLVIHACEYNQHNNHGRTIAVASVVKTKSHVGSSSTLAGYHMTLNKGSGCADSNAAFGHFPDSVRNHCNSYAAAGVFCAKSTDIRIMAASSRLKTYNPHGANEAFMFG